MGHFVYSGIDFIILGLVNLDRPITVASWEVMLLEIDLNHSESVYTFNLKGWMTITRYMLRFVGLKVYYMNFFLPYIGSKPKHLFTSKILNLFSNKLFTNFVVALREPSPVSLDCS